MNRQATVATFALVLLVASACHLSSAQNTRKPGMLPWSSQIQSVYPKWVVGRTYHFTTRIQPTAAEQVTGPNRPDAPVFAVVWSGNCHVSNFSASLWKPGKSNVVTIRYDYTPLSNATGSGHVIYLLTKQKSLAATITHHSARP